MDDKINSFKEHKKNKYGFFPYLLFGAFFVIIIVMIISATAQNSSKKTYSNNVYEAGNKLPDTDSKETEEGSPALAVLKEVDTEAMTITLLDTESGQDMILTYSGATNIIDKYEKVIAASVLNPGDLVDVYYDKNTSVLSKLQISNRAWEYKGVVNWGINKEDNSFSILNSKYRISDNVLILKEGKKLTLRDLDTEDELVVKGYERQIWTILVSKGHGSIRFEDYDDFVGGTVYIGSRQVLPVTSDMSVTIREGSYQVTMEKGSLKGTKNVTVHPFEETVLNMGEFKLPPEQKGKVRFNITPEGADLYINDELYDDTKTIELEYGEYKVKVSLGGYIDYSGKIEVAEPEKTITIKLAQSKKSNTGDHNTSDNSNNNQTNQNTQNNQSTQSNQNNQNKNNSSSNKNTNQESNTANYTEVKAKNNIYIEAPEGASAYFDGQFKGTVPVSFPKETGTHYITLIKSGYQTKTYSVEISDDGEDVKYSFPELQKNE